MSVFPQGQGLCTLIREGVALFALSEIRKLRWCGKQRFGIGCRRFEYLMHLNHLSNRSTYKAMEKHKKFPFFNMPEPQAGLVQKIIHRIERRERRLLFAKVAGFGACIIGSLSLAGFGFMDAATELSRSGFFSFISLVFSDFSSTIANFPDFIFSITESLPAIPIALLFGGIVFFMWAAARFTREISTGTHAHQFSVLK